MIKTLYRSLYWRIGFGFILCLAGVLTFQAAVVFALLNRTEAVGESLTQAASAALGQAIATEPRRDLQRFFEEHYPSPPRSMFAVLSTGQVLTAGRKAHPGKPQFSPGSMRRKSSARTNKAFRTRRFSISFASTRFFFN